MSIIFMSTLIVHRLLAWIAGSTVATTLGADCLIFAGVAAMSVRSIGRWIWLTLALFLIAASVIALRPGLAVTMFGGMVMASLLVAFVAMRRMPSKTT